MSRERSILKMRERRMIYRRKITLKTWEGNMKENVVSVSRRRSVMTRKRVITESGLAFSLRRRNIKRL